MYAFIAFKFSRSNIISGSSKRVHAKNLANAKNCELESSETDEKLDSASVELLLTGISDPYNLHRDAGTRGPDWYALFALSLFRKYNTNSKKEAPEEQSLRERTFIPKYKNDHRLDRIVAE